MEINKTIHY